MEVPHRFNQVLVAQEYRLRSDGIPERETSLSDLTGAEPFSRKWGPVCLRPAKPTQPALDCRSIQAVASVTSRIHANLACLSPRCSATEQLMRAILLELCYALPLFAADPEEAARWRAKLAGAE